MTPADRPPVTDSARAECPFCDRIQRGDYRDDCGAPTVVHFEPLNPVTPDHMLFVPQWHARHPDADAVAEAMRSAVRHAEERGEDFNLITSSGQAATQTVEHVHVHYVPRRADDGLPLPWTPQQAAGRAEVAEQIATDLKNTRVICPNHKMPDCSPLLNGCALPGIMFACYRDAARIAQDPR